jgi:glycosyltransferase involved in cell wall biosynthesis
MKNKFSIITAVYNTSKYLDDYFNFLLIKENIKNIEIILVNDGSTDNSEKKYYLDKKNFLI